MLRPFLFVEAFETELEAVAHYMEHGVRLEIHRTMRDVMDDVADYARTNHGYQDRTHELTNSIRGGVEVVHSDGTDGFVEATALHASFVEEGTQAHDIYPRGSSLRWTDDGGEEHHARHVQHPGTPALPFLQPAAHTAGARFVQLFDVRVERRLKRILRGERS